MKYDVKMTDEAMASSKHIHNRNEIAKIRKLLLLLDTVPEIGRVYDPDYEAAMLPFPMRVVHAGHYSIYYTIHEEVKEVLVIAIESQRTNPRNRFGGSFGGSELTEF